MEKNSSIKSLINKSASRKKAPRAKLSASREARRTFSAEKTSAVVRSRNTLKCDFVSARCLFQETARQNSNHFPGAGDCKGMIGKLLTDCDTGQEHGVSLMKIVSKVRPAMIEQDTLFWSYKHQWIYQI